MIANRRSPGPRPLRWIPALLLLVAAGQAALLLGGCGAKSEQSAATPEASAPAPAAPAPDTSSVALAVPPELTQGAAIFKEKCVLCHGPSGHGDGTAAKALKPPPRNFHDKAYMSTRTDEQLLEVIHKGKGSMPPWGTVLKDDEIAAVLRYVRYLGTQP